MRITIVAGFFLPFPPVQGGATEKSWYRLAQYFAGCGHQVTLVSRTWDGLDESDPTPGIRHLRLPGRDHETRLHRNLWHDLRWSWRVFRKLPPADILVVNAVALPVWVARWKPRAGKLVIMTGRVPKGQYRWYGRVGLALAASSTIRDAVVAENPRLAPVTSVWGYPLDHARLAFGRPPADPAAPLTLGFIGRIHREKGLELLADALEQLNHIADLPPWRLLIVGPHEVTQGGSGVEFQRRLETRLRQTLGDRLVWQGPVFEPDRLVEFYQQIDVFCLPSLSEAGETFGVAAAEAGAAGAAPVVSQLSCFRDFVEDGISGRVFNHRLPTADRELARILAELIRQPATVRSLGRQAQAVSQRYDFAQYGERLLAEFTQLTSE